MRKKVADYGLDGRKHYKNKLISHLKDTRRFGTPSQERFDKFPSIKNSPRENRRAERVVFRPDRSYLGDFQEETAPKSTKKILPSLGPAHHHSAHSKHELEQTTLSRSYLMNDEFDVSFLNNSALQANFEHNEDRQWDRTTNYFVIGNEEAEELDSRPNFNADYLNSSAMSGVGMTKKLNKLDLKNLSFDHAPRETPIKPLQQRHQNSKTSAKTPMLLQKGFRSNSVSKTRKNFPSPRTHSPQPIDVPLNKKQFNKAFRESNGWENNGSDIKMWGKKLITLQKPHNIAESHEHHSLLFSIASEIENRTGESESNDFYEKADHADDREEKAYEPNYFIYETARRNFREAGYWWNHPSDDKFKKPTDSNHKLAVARELLLLSQKKTNIPKKGRSKSTIEAQIIT